VPELGDTFQVEGGQKCSFSCINIKSLNLIAVMNYLKVYCNLIRKAEERGYTKNKTKELELYVEGHHTFPKSIYGKNNRIVYLTAREHYIAHALLVKICIKRYEMHHWKSKKMIYAFWAMNNQKMKNNYRNSYLYECTRMRKSILMTGEKNPMYGKLGEENPLYGRKLSEEHKAKIGLKSKGRKMSEESKIKIGDSNRGREKSPETRAKISEKNKGRKISNELKEYFSVKYAGENNPYYGRKHSPEVIEKMSGENHHKSMWWKITFEDGSVIEKCGLTTWAKENKYNCSAIRRLASKKIKRYKNVVSIEKLSQHK
jgi:hypothetical protein